MLVVEELPIVVVEQLPIVVVEQQLELPVVVVLADVVLVEAAVLVENGEPNKHLISDLAAGLDVKKVFFELPGAWIKGTTTTEVIYLKKFLIDEFGPDVNIANVLPGNVFETEALRSHLSFAGPQQMNRAAE